MDDKNDVPAEISLNEGQDYKLEGLTEDGSYIVYESEKGAEKLVPIERAYAEEEVSIAVNIAECLSEKEQQTEQTNRRNSEALTDDRVTGVGESLEDGKKDEDDEGVFR